MPDGDGPGGFVIEQRVARPGRVYYGWYIVAIATVGAFLGGGLTSQVFFGVMLTPLTEDLGWSRTEISGAITLGTLSGGLLAPPCGLLVDRFGPRVLAPVGAFIVSIALILIANVQSLLLFYVAFILARGFSSAVLSGVVTQTLAVNWFRRMRGRVLGLLSMAVPLGGSVGALVAQPIIDGPGWRTFFWLAPAFLIVTFAIPALLIFRKSPEDIGLRPDGSSGFDEDGSPTQPLPEASMTVREAFRTSALWLLISAMILGRLAGGAVSFHLVAFYIDKGLGSGTAASAISLYALLGAVASLMWGFLIERVSEKLLLIAAMVLSGVSLMLMIPVQAALPALVLASLFGLAGRGEGTLIHTVLAQYYGRKSFGRILGLVSPFNMAALGLGPLVASLSFDLAGSYSIVFTLFSGGYLLGACLLLFVRAPQQKERLDVTQVKVN